MPKQSAWKLTKDAAYVHICSNETIGGVEYHWTPDTGAVPLVADMSSHILSRPLDVSKYGLIYAGAQKNIGPAGLVLVIVREDLLGGAMAHTPTVLDYKKMAEADSMVNTPPTFSVYLAGLTFKWLLERGGLEGIEKANVAQGEAALRLHRRAGLLRQPGGEGRPLAHERAVHAARQRRSTRPSSPKRKRSGFRS